MNNRNSTKPIPGLSIFVFFVSLVFWHRHLVPVCAGHPFILKHDLSNAHLKIELLKDRGLHFELLQFARPKTELDFTMLVKESIELDKSYQQKW